MGTEQCLRALGLGRLATSQQVFRAYRRLAVRYHPDRNPGDATARLRFLEITEAMRLLQMRGLAAGGGSLQLCQACRNRAADMVGLDGRSYCWSCALHGWRSRTLPAGPMTMVQCLGPGLCLAISAVAMVMFLAQQGSAYALASLTASGLGLLGLAATCIRVVYTADARRLVAARRRGRAIRTGPKRTAGPYGRIRAAYWLSISLKPRRSIPKVWRTGSTSQTLSS